MWHIGTGDSARKQERGVCQREGLKYFVGSSEFSALQLLAMTNHPFKPQAKGAHWAFPPLPCFLRWAAQGVGQAESQTKIGCNQGMAHVPPNPIKIIILKRTRIWIKMIFHLNLPSATVYPTILDEASGLLEADFPLTLFKQWQPLLSGGLHSGHHPAHSLGQPPASSKSILWKGSNGIFIMTTWNIRTVWKTPSIHVEPTVSMARNK